MARPSTLPLLHMLAIVLQPIESVALQAAELGIEDRIGEIAGVPGAVSRRRSAPRRSDLRAALGDSLNWFDAMHASPMSSGRGSRR